MPAPMTLYPFQEEGVRHLLLRRSVLLADEMGLGKTIQAAVALRRLFSQEAIRRVLIVCPASLCRNWRQELRQWCPGAPVVLYEGADRFGLLTGGAPILISSYDTVAADLSAATSRGGCFADLDVDVVILDEAQRIKDPKSVRAAVLAKVMAPRRWAITGTPLENHPRELASILRFLHPNELADDSALNDAVLILSLRDQSLVRRTKETVGLQLPAKTIACVPVPLSPAQAAEYAQKLAEVTQAVSRAGSMASASSALLAGLQSLRRIASVASTGDSSKLDLLEEEIPELVEEGRKVVIFSSFAGLVLPVVAQRLERHGTVLYTGAMTQEEREVVHRRFLEDRHTHIMCASLQAAGVGLTWTVASYVYQFDLWWNPQVLRQAEDRVHRIGQTRPVLVKRLIADGTIEDGIQQLLEAKTRIFEYVIENAKGVAADASSIEGLLSLIGLRLGDLNASANPAAEEPTSRQFRFECFQSLYDTLKRLL